MPSPSPFLDELRELWRLAAPLAVVHAGNQLMGFVDTAVVGRLSTEAQGGAGLGGAIFFVFSIVGMGIMMGLDPLVSQALGAGDRLRARRLLWQATWLALALGLLLSLPVLVAGLFLPLFKVKAAVAAQAAAFLAMRATGILPLLLFVGARSYLQAVGRTRPMLLSMVLGNLFNVGAAILLVFGGRVLPSWMGPLRHLPSFGVAGVAAATTLCSFFQLAILAVALRALPIQGFTPAMRRPDAREIQRALVVGLPIGLQMGAEVGIFTLVALLAGGMSPNAIAAHNVAITLASFTFTVALGIGAAGSVRVGRAIGRGDALGTRRAGLAALASGGGFMAVSALTFLSFPALLARILSPERDVVREAIPLLLVAALFQVSDGIQSVAAGVLRGAGDTLFPFLANLAGHYLIGLPIAVGVGLWAGKGVVGLWWGLCAGLTAVAAALLVRFLSLSSQAIRPLRASDR